MIESNTREALMKTRNILRDMLKECKDMHTRGENDTLILKTAKTKFNHIDKAFKDPNADY